MSHMSISNPASFPNRRGQYLLFAIIGLFVAAQIFSFYIGQPDFLRIVLFSLLFLLTYYGYKWARVLLGILYGIGSLLGIIAGVSVASSTANIVFLMVGLLLSFLALLSSAVLLSSKDLIAFLERNTVRSFDYKPLELSKKEILELKEKLRSRNQNELPTYEIRTALAVPNTADKILLLDYSSSFRNIIRCNNDGSMIWQAELPTATGDVYTNVEWRDRQLTAFSMSCVAVHLDLETGKILPSNDVQNQRAA